jgi:hypothetical protein
MGHEENLSQIILRTIADDEFRQQLVNEPEEAARSIGVELDSTQVKRIKELNPDELERLVRLLRSTLYSAAGTLW